MADLIEGAAEVATVNPLAERLKQGAGKPCDASCDQQDWTDMMLVQLWSALVRLFTRPPGTIMFSLILTT